MRPLEVWRFSDVGRSRQACFLHRLRSKRQSGYDIGERKMCEMCYVDEAIKGKIIARNAEFHKVASSPFGEDDEAGMLNLIDARSRTAILRRADPTRVYDLSVDHFIGMPRLDRRRRPALPDMDDAHAAGRGRWRQHEQGQGGQLARRLLRRRHLDVHPLRHSHRYVQSFRLQWRHLQQLHRARSSRQPCLAQMRRRKAAADLCPWHPARCRGHARHGHTRAEPCDR